MSALKKLAVDRERFREALSGPIASVHTPFLRNGEIDFVGLRNLIDAGIAGGSKTVLLTYGNSLFSILTDAEAAEVTRVVAEHVAGRALVVAADRAWATAQEVEFAQYARSVGADMLMVLPPNWGNSCTIDTLVDHYSAVAAHIPVMMVTNLFVNMQAQGLQVIELLRDQVPNVMAVKDDVVGNFGRKLSLAVYGRWAVLAGGQKQHHMNALPYGCDGYLSTFVLFRPDITQSYWSGVQARDWTRAGEIIRRYDMPFFDYILQLPGGFDAGIHGVIELYGLAQRWRRRPYYSLNDTEMEQLADLCRARGLL